MTRLMLQDGRYRKIVCSTIPEIEGSLPLVEEGLLDECIFGMPVLENMLPRLTILSKKIKLDLLVDNNKQVKFLEASGTRWDVYVKIDVGAQRAGLTADSPQLKELVKGLEAPSNIHLVGFYCHANHSYACRNEDDAKDMLQNEIDCVLMAASLLPTTRPIKVSIGATPTAHVIDSLRASIPSNISLELHAGNFPTNDLQQVSTGTIPLSSQAVRIGADIVSIYPERNEALMNAGVIVLARETSAFSGFGKVVNQPAWSVMRVSQEHGILGTTEPSQSVEETFQVGERVWLWCQHSCITAAAFYVYYLVDEKDVVVDTWVPWKGW
jgi:D-serine deaminase-like pyridoxal phosphate-dependent protein